MNEPRRICDYGDSTYRQDFWEGQGREYEDAVERRLLRQILPRQGRRLLEIGAGFGRITDEFARYDQVALLDYSLEQLQYARQRFGDSGFLYVAADAYRMPFQPAAFDCAAMIRVIHHFEDVPAVLAQVRRVLARDSRFILEFANKRHLKAMLRHALGWNGWNPYSREAVEFVELNFNFHPDAIRRDIETAGFKLRRSVPVSWFRLRSLKRTLPARWLASMDQLLQRAGWEVAPSVFFDLRASGQGEALIASNDPLDLLLCPRTGSSLRRQGESLVSEGGQRWAIRGGVYDFREPSQD